MDRIWRLLLAFLLAFSPSSRAQPHSDVVVVDMPVMDFITHVYGGPVSARGFVPLALVIDANKSVRSTVAGVIHHLQGDQVPSYCATLVDAMARGETLNLTEREVKKYGSGFVAAAEAGLKQAPPSFASGPIVVLIRNEKRAFPADIEIVNQLNLMWEQVLRRDFKKIDPSAKLLIIQIVSPS